MMGAELDCLMPYSALIHYPKRGKAVHLHVAFVLYKEMKKSRKLQPIVHRDCEGVGHVS